MSRGVDERGGRWSAIGVTDHRFAHLGGAHVGANIERGAGFFEAFEITVQGGPVDVEFEVVGERLHGRNGEIGLRSDRCAFTSNFTGDSLGKLADGTVVDQQGIFGLSEHVDEAGGNPQTLSVDYLFGVSVIELSDGRDLLAANGNVTGDPGIAGAVDDRAVLDDYVVITVGSGCGAGGRAGRGWQRGVVGGGCDLAQGFTGDGIDGIGIVQGQGDHVDVESQDQVLAARGIHVAGKAFALDHEFLVQRVVGAVCAGFGVDVAGSGRIYFDFDQSAVLTEDRQRAIEVAAIL